MRGARVETQKKFTRMKPEVYEQLARTFLEKKKTKPAQKKPKAVWFIAATTIFALLVLIPVLFGNRTAILQRSLYVGLGKTPVVIPYNFNNPQTDRIKAVSFSLGDIDISRYRFLDFRARLKNEAKVDSAIKVQLENALKEISSTYITGLTFQWKKFSLPLNAFKQITDHTSVQSLSFMIEDWNLADKENEILIEEIRFIK